MSEQKFRVVKVRWCTCTSETIETMKDHRIKESDLIIYDEDGVYG